LNDTVSAPDGFASVGSQLRAAREAARLSMDEVAHALKFSPRQIELLESDQYEALPGNTIVRGFVRNYARLLRLDADGLLQQLVVVMPSMPVEVRPPDNMGIASQPRSLRELSSFVVVALVALMAAILLVLWHFFGPVATKTSLSDPVQVPQQEQHVAVAPAPGSVPSALPVMPPAGVVDPVMPPPASPVADMSAPTLRFQFADRSWVEVTDANRQLLHSGENPGGGQLTLTGKPPFEIVIGNAGKVTLTYGDRQIDLVPHTRAEVARLTLE
jgi:cytoskeleton protein RodZ